uniref:XMAP215/Dis1/CLASP TOG domain-containing protein n=1 Tax=Phytophthora ramorum TaxID=164328 RepID=H3HA13_PHYRM
MQDPRGMTEKCLRNANCTCSMCAGFDVASLMSISKSISSNIEYEDEDGEGGQQEAPPAPKFGGVANSPIPAPRKALVSSSPPLPAARSQPQATEDVLMDVKVEGVAISGAAPVVKTPAAEKEVKKVVQDINMDAVATAFSNMKVVSGGPEESVSLDEVLPKLTDKNWKARKEAFEELKTVFEQPGVTTERARPAMGLFSKMCEDSNASAMEAGIAAVLAYTLNVQPFEKEIVSG